MEEIPTFYTELTDKVLHVKSMIGQCTEEQLMRAMHNLYCFCLGAVAQHTEDDAKQLMKERNRSLHERIERIRDREFEEVQGQSRAEMAKDDRSAEKRWIDALRSEEAELRAQRQHDDEIPMSIMGTPLP